MTKKKLDALMKYEGFFEEFEHNGLKCVIQRNLMGVWCGYVGITPVHPLYGFDYNDIIKVPKKIRSRKVDISKLSVIDLFKYCLDNKDKLNEIDEGEMSLSLALQVHGGITFARSELADGRTWDENHEKCTTMYSSINDNTWWFGFDCGHHGDIVPKYLRDEDGYGDKALHTLGNGVYRDKEFVIEETKALADQLVAFKFDRGE